MSSNKQNHHSNCNSCDCKPSNLQVTQSLTEMDFERGIWNAALNNEIDRVRDFIRKGHVNDRDNSGYTALHYATRSGYEEICKILVDGNCDVNAQTNGGVTSLHRAAMMGHIAIVKLLLKSSANVDIQDQDGRTPLHRAAVTGNVVVCEELLQSCPTLRHVKDKKGLYACDLTENMHLKKLLAIGDITN